MSVRLKLLVGGHLVLGAAPVALCLFPPVPDLRWFLLFLVLPYSEVLLVSFWAGLGTSRERWRWLGSLFASAYLTLGPSAAFIFSMDEARDDFVPVLWLFFYSACATIVLYGSLFWLIRWWVAGMKCFPDPPTIPRTRLQFSIFRLVLITAAVAVALGLARIGLLVLVTLLVPLAVPWATLCMGSVRRRIVLVLGITLLLGIAVPFPVNSVVRSPEWRWLSAAETLYLTLPIAIMVLSLLVVRSCGYRLVAEARERNVPAVGTSGPAA
jgi:hypothetical protein